MKKKSLDIKNSFLWALLFMGIGLGVTAIMGVFQFVMIIVPPSLGGGDLVFHTMTDYVNLFCGIILGMFVLPILEAFGIFKFGIRSSDETGDKATEGEK